MRVSYNGYYVSFPRMRLESDSPYPHHIKMSPSGSILIWYDTSHPPVAVEAIDWNKLMEPGHSGCRDHRDGSDYCRYIKYDHCSPVGTD